MRFGITYGIYRGGGYSVAQIFQQTIEQILLAESYGFDCVFISEHHFFANELFPSPLMALSYIAAKTSKIRLGTGVLLLPLADPIRVAEDAAVLDVISGGRLILGIGQGYVPQEFQAFGRKLKDRPALMREGATLIRKLWTEPSVTYRGTHFHVDGVSLAPKTVQKPPPIWVAAKKKKAVELAAEVGDGWYADPITPLPIIRENKGHWERALQANGKDPAKQAFACYREFFVGPDDESAQKIGGQGVLGEFRMYSSLGHLVDEEGRPLPPNQEEGLVDLVRRRCTVGGPERCRADLQMIQDTLTPTHLVMKMKYQAVRHEDVMTSIRLAAEKVIP